MLYFSEDQVQLMTELYEHGCSTNKIGRKFNVHHDTIAKVLRKRGVSVNRLKEPTKRLPEPEKIVYFAGLFDGDGNTGVYPRKGHKAFRASLCVTNTSKSLMKWLVANFGGKFVLKKEFKPSNLPRRKPCFRWQCYRHREIYRLLKAILPFLVVKKDHVMIVIQALESSMERWNL